MEQQEEKKTTGTEAGSTSHTLASKYNLTSTCHTEIKNKREEKKVAMMAKLAHGMMR
jgi:hypothetical protein